MYIVQVASELAPIAKVGGLGDVVYGLSKELVKEGHQVEIFLPKYDNLKYELLDNLKVEYPEVIAANERSSIWSAEFEGLKLTLIESHHKAIYFNRGKIYGFSDDVDRFLHFSQTVIESLVKMDKTPDVIHLHDWPTAAIAVLHKQLYARRQLRKTKIVLTLHSMEHQGKCSMLQISRLGLDAEEFKDPAQPHLANVLKGGIVYADALTTVSPNYEREIKTVEGGHGLDHVLREYRHKLKGILNGINLDFWNPETDPYLLAAHYSKDRSIENICEAKAQNKKRLRLHLGLAEKKVPLVASVTRLVPQKGPHLIRHAILRTLEKGGQFVLLGSPSNFPEIDKSFTDLKKEYARNKNVSIILNNDEALAHQVFASADMFMMPSLFEPCGLTQLIALRYGTVPIARLTGGLVDTVYDVDTSSRPEGERNGFTFEFPDAQGVNWALDRALDCWTRDQKKWHGLIQHAMNGNFSWELSVKEYLKVYERPSFLKKITSLEFTEPQPKPRDWKPSRLARLLRGN